MAADSSMVDNRVGNTFGRNLLLPWDAPKSVVDVFSADVVPLRNLPDGMGLVGRKKMRQRVVSYKEETLVVSVCLFRKDKGLIRTFMM